MAKEQMATVKKLFDAHALWLSMLIGAVGYRLFIPLKPVLPWLIFFMLFFTFCKINPLDLRLHRWHWVVLALQMALSVGVYYALMALTGNQVLAQGLMLCFIMPGGGLPKRKPETIVQCCGSAITFLRLSVSL